MSINDFSIQRVAKVAETDSKIARLLRIATARQLSISDVLKCNKKDVETRQTAFGTREISYFKGDDAFNDGYNVRITHREIRTDANNTPRPYAIRIESRDYNLDGKLKNREIWVNGGAEKTFTYETPGNFFSVESRAKYHLDYLLRTE